MGDFKLKEKKEVERDGEKEAVAVMQSVESATINDGFVGVGRREGRNHHRIIVNRHSWQCKILSQSRQEYKQRGVGVK